MATDSTQPAAEQPRQGTLEEYAAGVHQANFDLQRQSSAFGYLRDVCAMMRELETQPDKIQQKALPRIYVLIPTDGTAPDKMEMDLNTLPTDYAVTTKPMFEMFASSAGAQLQQAWARIHQLNNGAQAILQIANQAQVTQQAPPPQQAPQPLQ
jgi:hypothetical protein